MRFLIGTVPEAGRGLRALVNLVLEPLLICEAVHHLAMRPNKFQATLVKLQAESEVGSMPL
jgi:hypothetical protein